MPCWKMRRAFARRIWNAVPLRRRDVSHRGGDRNARRKYSEVRRQRGLIPAADRAARSIGHADEADDLHRRHDAAHDSIACAAWWGAFSGSCVPMLKDDVLVGAIIIYRQEVRPFPKSKSNWWQNFAAQAVIAIENTRLLNELRQSLEQQTATADVLHSHQLLAWRLEPVFHAMLENATRICAAKFGNAVSVTTAACIRASRSESGYSEFCAGTRIPRSMIARHPLARV